MDSKPNWKDAPEWANWLAFDATSCQWYWYEFKPDKSSQSAEWLPNNGNFRCVGTPLYWDESLEERPENDN